MEKTRRPSALIIGSGLAGLECALDLAVNGFSVEVVSPGRVGRDGATHRVHALAPWVLVTAPWVRGDSPELYLADLKRRGEGEERSGLAEVLAAEAHTAARDLIEALDLEPLPGGPATLPGDELPRGLRCLARGGHVLLAPLLKRCESAGVRLSGRSLVVGIAADGGRATGALVLDRATRNVRTVNADAVVLACGGVGAVFPVTTVPRWVRGSGLALASAAGALLHRPEATQALPVTATAQLYFPTSAALLAGRIRINGRVVAPFRDVEALTLAIGEALLEGATVALEPSEEDPASLPPSLRESAAFRVEKTVPLTLALHHGIGGVAIDTWGRTSLPGLYACGEAAGGVQGRRRMMGTGLLEALIFARRCARAMCRDVRGGGAPSAVEILAPPVPADAAVLEGRLDALMGALVALRPGKTVASALREIEGWPEEGAPGSDEKAALAGIRRLAAVTILKGELGRDQARQSGGRGE
ncbi:MAG TPA: FAD-dependent oxidoreductase [Thermoanaerobaculaceae bacterium]|nr:FAD-dependent oxidoreductase [Thermoanaerobaculaceae bacterium]